MPPHARERNAARQTTLGRQAGKPQGQATVAKQWVP
jgi:hypothetical protein